MILNLVFVLTGSLAFAAGSCWTKSGHFDQVAHDVAYQKGSDSQKLDVYTPSNVAPPFKTVISIHGGCFQWGSKSAVEDMAQIARFTNAGYAVVSVDYRLTDAKRKKNLFPASLEDVQDATRWVRKNGAKYNLQTDQLMAFGYSAGATLAAYLGTRTIKGSSARADDMAADDPALSARVSGVIDLFGRTDFSHSFKTEKHSDDGRDCGEEYLGENRIAQDEKKFAVANVLNGVDASAAKFLIMHGTQDQDVSVEHSELLYDKLIHLASFKADTKKERVQFYKIKGAAHMFDKPGEMNEAWAKICPFLTEVLGEPNPLKSAGY